MGGDSVAEMSLFWYRCHSEEGRNLLFLAFPLHTERERNEKFLLRGCEGTSPISWIAQIAMIKSITNGCLLLEFWFGLPAPLCPLHGNALTSCTFLHSDAAGHGPTRKLILCQCLYDPSCVLWKNIAGPARLHPLCSTMMKSVRTYNTAMMMMKASHDLTVHSHTVRPYTCARDRIYEWRSSI